MSGLSDATVLGLVRSAWGYGVDRVEALPPGAEGRRCWRATDRGRPVLFVTYDALLWHRTGDDLEDAYAAAADLAFALDFVVSSVPSSAGTYTLPVAGGALSATPWVSGQLDLGSPVDRAEAEDRVRMLTRLHGAHPPRRTPRWTPLVPADWADTLGAQLAPSGAGPQPESTRADLRARLGEVDAWVAAYHRLAGAAAERPWVPTHGEPHGRNVLRTPVRTLLADWASLRVAPRERDLHALLEAGHGALVAPDPEMLHLFDLERRLAEVDRLVRHADQARTSRG